MSQFGKILGNEKNIRHFSEALKKGQMSHAYIICGKEGSGKRNFTENIAAGIFCEEEGVLPCGKCAGCIKTASDNHPDIIKVRHEKKDLITIGEIREQVVEDIIIKPYYGPYKVYIIEDADLMNINAQNALLKTIEEPPEYGIIFLITKNPDGLIDTIKSRCIRIDMGLLSDTLIENELLSKGISDKSEIKKIIRFARGNLGRALALKEDSEISDVRKNTGNLLADIKQKTAFEIFQIAKQVEKDDAIIFLEMIYTWFRDVLVCKSTGNANDIYFIESEGIIKKQADNTEYEGLNNIFLSIDEALRQINANVKVEAAIEAMLIKIRDNILERGR